MHHKTIRHFESKEHTVNSVYNITMCNLVYIFKQQILGGFLNLSS
jgi:hypothetical protein